MSTAQLAPPASVPEPVAAPRPERLPTPMQRLPFMLPDFTRTSWVSDAAREVWRPRVQRITNAWIEIEWQAIVSGVRSCCITMAAPEQFLERGAKWAELGLNALPVAIQGVGTSGYSATPVGAELGKPFLYRFVLGSPKHVSEFKRFWDAGDDRGIGTLLGYPPCCREFFKRVWVDEGLVDTTWPMAAATEPPRDEGTFVEVTSSPQANILWRWMGVRAVSHLPCSFHCQATVELANRFIEVGRKSGFEAEMDWLLEILDWPVEWSALHGIAEVKTPILKVSTRTDATPCSYVVRRKGSSYPEEGARGLTFPYKAPALPLLTESPSYKRGIDNPIGETITLRPPWYASDNGFSSTVAMDRSHQPIVELAKAHLSTDPGAVLDLGCGNGALLKKLLEVNPSIVPFGIDSEPARVAHAGVLLPDLAQNFTAGDMYENEAIWPAGRRYALVLLMPGRLLEVGPERTSRLKARLRAHCDRVLVYAYGDWLARYGNLKGLVSKAGLECVGPDGESAPAAFATVP